MVPVVVVVVDIGRILEGFDVEVVPEDKGLF